jgi:hypothetical protein
MYSGLRILFCTGVSASALAAPGLAFAVTMGSVAPHDSAANEQASQQWVADPRTKCIAADPSYSPDDSISWRGSCRKDGIIYGAGKLTFLNKGQVVETINGTFTDGLLKPGAVTATWSDGTKYEGGQLGGLFNGTGKFVSPKGDTLDGEWKMGVLNGKASVAWANGDRYDGEWKNGRSDGEGVEVWSDGRRYEGQWREGAPVGEVQANGNETPASAGTTAVALNTPAETSAHTPTESASAAPQAAVNPASFVRSTGPTPAPLSNPSRKAAVETSGNAVPNPALPLRSELGTELVAVDGATLELGLTHDGFQRTLVLPNGNSQQIQFAFANGPVGTVSNDEKAIGVFRAKASELDIDYADGATETIGEGAAGSLSDHAQSADGRTMCTAWYPQGHVFGQSEKQAAVQEYANRLGLPASAPSKKQRAHDASPACGGAFVASGSPQKAAGAENATPKPVSAPSRASAERVQLDERVPEQRTTLPGNGVVAVRASAVQLVDEPNKSALAPAHLENASFAPGQPLEPSSDLRAGSGTPSPQPGASDCLSVTSNGEYWGFQNRCAKSVQFAYCEMSDANPLTSCKRTSVAGSVAANSFGALVSDRSLAEKNTDHEFRWMACDGGAGEVVPHLDKIDPPSGRCERAVPPAE